MIELSVAFHLEPAGVEPYLLKDRIDHTLLAPYTSRTDIDRLCREALEHNLYAVCVPPLYVGHALDKLRGSDVQVVTVISFPYGYAETPIKVNEARRALDAGADELDIVINLAAVRSGDWAYVRNDVTSVVTAVRLKGKVSKIIVEAQQLSEAEKEHVCEICNAARPTFVKTSTGTRGGATVEDVRYLRANLHPDIKIKASGGIRTNQSARALVEAGADRIGTSSGVAVSQH